MPSSISAECPKYVNAYRSKGLAGEDGIGGSGWPFGEECEETRKYVVGQY